MAIQPSFYSGVHRQGVSRVRWWIGQRTGGQRD
jgi:hypothetical protein